MEYIQYEQVFRQKAKQVGYSEDNIVKCLNYAQPLIEKKLPVIFNSSNLAALVGYNRNYIKRAVHSTKFFYREFDIQKKDSDNKRKIKEPLPSLKEIQSWLLQNILSNVKISRFAKAYIPNITLKDNVKYHKGQPKVLCIDIENFFSSISEKDVFSIYLSLGYSKRVSITLSKLCCLDNQLPQGAPTSPAISNIYMRKFDKVVADYCVKNKIRYTRYADDITFSGSFDEAKLQNLVFSELKLLHLKPNLEKCRMMTNNMRQIVTGIVVNEKLQVPKEKRKEIRQAIYYIEKYGLENHLSHIGNSKHNYLKHLLGLVNYVLFINPNDCEAIKHKQFLFRLMDIDDLPF